MERLKNFSFDEWRRRYMNWHKDNRARITDFFRRQDRDHDGKISRDEFIDGILSSSKHFLFVKLHSFSQMARLFYQYIKDWHVRRLILSL